MADQFTSVRWDADDQDSRVEHPVQPTPIPEASGSENNEEGTESEDNGSDLITQKMLSDAHKSDEDLAAAVPSSVPSSEASSGHSSVHSSVPSTPRSKLAEEEEEERPHEAAQPPPPPITLHLIQTTVTDPITEREGQNAYTSYLIKVKTEDPAFPRQTAELRRRYSDFYFLYECLVNDYPTLLIPPLPNKQRLEYIKGGRFSDEFTTKRAISLSNFLHRLCRHPQLRQSSVLRTFLSDTDVWNTYKANLKVPAVGSIDATNSTSQNLETVTEFIMNSFKKPTLESASRKEFQEIDDKTSKLQDNLTKIDHIYARVTKRQQSIADDLSKFGEEFGNLALLLGNDVDGKHRDTSEMDDESRQLVGMFENFGGWLSQTSRSVHALDQSIEYRYLTALKDLTHYIAQLKDLLKVKDSKALDYEMLTHYLKKAREEKDGLVNGGSITASAEGTLSFLTRKLESVTGLGSGSVRAGAGSGNLTNDRIEKLDARIKLLEAEQSKAHTVYEKYERDILKEYAFFNETKNAEIAGSLQALGDCYYDFYKNVGQELEKFKVNSTGKPAIFDSKLTKDGKVFSNNVVQQNSKVIADNIHKIESLAKD